jgi:hypothetical protein
VKQLHDSTRDVLVTFHRSVPAAGGAGVVGGDCAKTEGARRHARHNPRATLPSRAEDEVDVLKGQKPCK